MPLKYLVAIEYSHCLREFQHIAVNISISFHVTYNLFYLFIIKDLLIICLIIIISIIVNRPNLFSFIYRTSYFCFLPIFNYIYTN